MIKSWSDNAVINIATRGQHWQGAMQLKVEVTPELLMTFYSIVKCSQ